MQGKSVRDLFRERRIKFGLLIVSSVVCIDTTGMLDSAKATIHLWLVPFNITALALLVLYIYFINKSLRKMQQRFRGMEEISPKFILDQKKLLKLIAQGAPLIKVLDTLVRTVEQQSSPNMCSIFMIDENEKLMHASSSGLPEEFVRSLQHISMDPAAWTFEFGPKKHALIVSDIETDIHWAAHRSVALRHGLRKCWSKPIFSANGAIIGVLALYPANVTEPGKQHIDMLETFTHLAGMTIEHHIVERKVEKLALTDSLTGLPNRHQFFNELPKAIKHSKWLNQRLAVMFLDLDRFKAYNDSLGHHVGDTILQIASTRIKQSIPVGGMLSRTAGDEFAIMIPIIDSDDGALSLANRIMRTLEDPIEVDGYELRLTTSIGISCFPEHGTDAHTLMRNATTAMNYAKAHGKNTYETYRDALNEKSNDRLMVESQLIHAIANGELFLHYQPRVDIHTGRVTSAEALLRWQNPTLGLVSPGEFIPIAEDTGLIVSVGKWVLETAVGQIKSWLDAGIEPVRIAVNVSANQFHESDMIGIIDAVLDKNQVESKWLEIEITESTLIENREEAVSKLQELERLGVMVSIDDFGIGYSSLARLQQLPVNALKIDQSFIRNMESDNGAITTAIIALGHNLHLHVIAEGVETQEQLESLRNYGCDEMQGFLISRPVAVDVFEREFLTQLVSA